ncbi:DUF6340 family protein [Cecembia rubra]|uniref:DUF6340 family protein n=1 Tax=Cecembia rubra TaxID=1485585 RepID=UPI002715405A|nr:DUF6340 family protein [Cecembia rubra]
MKQINFSFFILLLASLLFSCTRTVTMNRMAPADITVPSYVQRILLVDRTAPQNETVSVIQGILTGEAPFEVKNAAEATLTTIQQELNQSPRFEVIRARERLVGGLFAQTFPTPLTWQQVEGLCDQYQVDAILVLEKFSSDFIVTDKRQMIKKTVGTGKEARQIEVMGVYMEGLASVSAGFRFYDPQSKNIFDQINYDKTNLWSAEAETRLQAAAMLIDKVRATQFVGRMAGASYARRIAPMPITITRSMYEKPRSNFSLAKGSRLAQVGRWEDALETWQQGLSLPHSTKEGGRLAYNVALAYEVLGELEEARYWAGKSFTEYGFKEGRNYAGNLQRRINQDAIVRSQLERN